NLQFPQPFGGVLVSPVLRRSPVAPVGQTTITEIPIFSRPTNRSTQPHIHARRLSLPELLGYIARGYKNQQPQHAPSLSHLASPAWVGGLGQSVVRPGRGTARKRPPEMAPKAVGELM